MFAGDDNGSRQADEVLCVERTDPRIGPGRAIGNPLCVESFDVSDLEAVAVTLGLH